MSERIYREYRGKPVLFKRQILLPKIDNSANNKAAKVLKVVFEIKTYSFFTEGIVR